MTREWRPNILTISLQVDRHGLLDFLYSSLQRFCLEHLKQLEVVWRLRGRGREWFPGLLGNELQLDVADQDSVKWRLLLLLQDLQALVHVRRPSQAIHLPNKCRESTLNR